MKRIFRSFLLLFLLIATVAPAQNDAIEMAVDKKIIHPELLGYNENTALDDILQILPELINRSTGNVVSNYTIKLDGKDVGSAKDVVLIQTRLAEIDRIEVTTSPSAAEQTNGQGGAINVILRHPEEGTHGMAHLGVGYPWSVQPALYLGHKRGRLQLRSTLLFEYYSPLTGTSSETYRKRQADDPHRTLYLESANTRTHSFDETAKLDIEYTFDSLNTLRVWAMETGGFGWQNGTTTAESHTAIQGSEIFQFRFGSRQDNRRRNGINASAIAEFKHRYRHGGELTLEAGYNYRPLYTLKQGTFEGNYYEDEVNFYSRTTTKAHEVNLSLKSKHRLPLPDTDHRLHLTTGINTTYTRNNDAHADSVLHIDSLPRYVELDFANHTLYASPYLEWEYAWHGLTAKAGIRYQFYHRDMDYTASIYETGNSRRIVDDHDFTANLNLSYAVNRNHKLRFMFARNLIRPTGYEAYTDSIMDWSSMTLYEPDSVHNAHTYTLELDYIFDWNKGDHDLTLDCGLRYTYSGDMIVRRSHLWDAYPYIPVVSSYNGGIGHVGTIDLSLCYRYRGFSFAFAGNTYFSRNLFYYNLSLSPLYAFPRQWYLAGRFTYNSRIQQGQSYIGECFYAQIRLHKNIGAWTVYLELDDIFDYHSVDRNYYSDNEYTQLTYDQYYRAAAVGFSYKF